MIKKEQFGKMKDKDIYKFNLVNKNGMEVSFTNYGARIQAIKLKDLSGKMVDVVLGFDTAQEYVDDISRQGAIIGRYAGKTQNASIHMNGKEFKLSLTKPNTHSHGGVDPFENKLWTVLDYGDNDHGSFVEFEYISADLEEGYPGELKTSVTYTLTDKNEVNMDIKAYCETMSPVSITNHAYFNLNGSGTIHDHFAKFEPKKYLEFSGEGYATGKIFDVKNSPIECLEKNIPLEDAMKIIPNQAIDYTYPLNAGASKEYIGGIYSPKTGISMKVSSNSPAVVIYNACNLNAKSGKDVDHKQYAGFCIEPGGYPNSFNLESFPNQLAEKGKPWITSTTFLFSTTEHNPL